ncbi:MAG: alanine--tRNA ligase-related protein, partial [Roseovarius sp.]|nr:alanine--tRNA ligase-related protein [Roseovarius sp.]
MTEMLYREDPYRQEAETEVTGHTAEGGVILHRTIFYPNGGGQPGDSGRLAWPGGEIDVATTIAAGEGRIA